MAENLKNFGSVVFYNRHIIFKAIFSNTKQFVTMSESLNKVPDVDIDGHGRFKYILINVFDEANNVSKSIVRGYARAQWHRTRGLPASPNAYFYVSQRPSQAHASINQNPTTFAPVGAGESFQFVANLNVFVRLQSFTPIALDQHFRSRCV
ncbi:uncharacterized protein LOC107997018 isoform X2 [Apis cerana]|uniref:uncharacterized protein LOC107997018 isoform X2 n=1 Tax=Apis cerana TaxID=7461 RepID=UPI002B23E4D0|nr:uncharacterized protein LOC107997018 isoform X2 [Apis cerana]XP_061928271.1 uncharacterized protein LOC107997018 isoform X2 [Apis cerana]